jgi:hypothetical protein
MKKKLWSWILKLPAILLLIASFIGSIYASIKDIGGITWSASAVLLVILVLYFIGESLVERKDEWGF